MRITDLLDKRSIAFDKNPANKQETLDMAVDLMCASGKINDTEAYRKQVYLREEESTTGIGEGIAIPHGKGDCVSKPGLAAMVIKNGVDFDSLDGDPVTLLFLIAAPNTEDNVHLEVLSKLSMMLMERRFSRSWGADSSMRSCPSMTTWPAVGRSSRLAKKQPSVTPTMYSAPKTGSRHRASATRTWIAP